MATAARTIQSKNSVFQPPFVSNSLPAKRFKAPHPIYATAFKSPPMVLTRPVLEKRSGTKVMSITFTANIQLVTTAIAMRESTILFVPNNRRNSKNTAEIPNKTALVDISFCRRLLSAFARYAPVTLTIGKSMVKSKENEVPEENVPAKKVGTHWVTLSFNVLASQSESS